jgi:hypothetical protein
MYWSLISDQLETTCQRILTLNYSHILLEFDIISYIICNIINDFNYTHIH